MSKKQLGKKTFDKFVNKIDYFQNLVIIIIL